MTNNLSTIEGAQQEVIDQFEANLHAKGVLDAQFDPSTGLLGLISRIPDIEPSVNINLDIALTLSSSETSINYGESILLTATLLASYEGVGDVDLKTGEITGATITFKKGQTIIGTGITDNNGVATLTYTPVAADCDTTLNMSAVFSGTDNFNSANSTNINVTVNSKIELTSNKNILSYADEQKNPGSQVATLTATLYSSTPTGQTIQLYDASDDSVIGNMTDNNDGTYTYSYTSQGSGDIGFYAKFGNLSSSTYTVEDCIDYQQMTDNSAESRWTIPSAVSSASIFGYSSDGWKFGNASSYSNIYLDTTLTVPFSIEFTLSGFSGVQPIVVLTDSSKTRYASWNNRGDGYLVVTQGASASTVSTTSHSFITGGVYRTEFKNGTVSIYANDTLIVSESVSLPSTGLIRLDTGSSRYTQIKDLKIKPL